MNMNGIGDIFSITDSYEEAVKLAIDSCKRNRSIYWVVKITHTDTFKPGTVPVQHIKHEGE